MCTDGMAAYWLDSDATSPDAHEPQVWWTTTVSMKPCPARKRGGAVAQNAKPTRASRVAVYRAVRTER